MKNPTIEVDVTLPIPVIAGLDREAAEQGISRDDLAARILGAYAQKRLAETAADRHGFEPFDYTERS